MCINDSKMQTGAAPEHHSFFVIRTSAFVKRFHCILIHSGLPPIKLIAGFTLVEMVIALSILTFGLLAAGQMLYLSLSSSSLARSKGAAAIAVQDKLECLAEMYGQNSAASDLTEGGHGPVQVQVLNPVDGTILNCFKVTWVVNTIPDPRHDKVPSGLRVTVTAVPATAGGGNNSRISLNKVVSFTTLFSARAQ